MLIRQYLEKIFLIRTISTLKWGSNIDFQIVTVSSQAKTYIDKNNDDLALKSRQEAKCTRKCPALYLALSMWLDVGTEFFSASPYIFRDVTHDQVICNQNYYLKGKVSALPCDS